MVSGRLGKITQSNGSLPQEAEPGAKKEDALATLGQVMCFQLSGQPPGSGRRALVTHGKKPLRSRWGKRCWRQCRHWSPFTATKASVFFYFLNNLFGCSGSQLWQAGSPLSLVGSFLEVQELSSCGSVQFNHSVMSSSLRPHGPQQSQASLSITNSWSLL